MLGVQLSYAEAPKMGKEEREGGERWDIGEAEWGGGEEGERKRPCLLYLRLEQKIIMLMKGNSLIFTIITNIALIDSASRAYELAIWLFKR